MYKTMISPTKIQEISDILVKNVHPRKIILFGSYARGDASDDSDLDLLIVKDEVSNKRSEMVEARRLLSHLRVPVDILVTTEDHLNSSWKDYPGTYLYDATREGIVLYEMA